ncbi:MAG: hypothetical protein ACLVKO_09225 [Dysgonomonas sp.]
MKKILFALLAALPLAGTMTKPKNPNLCTSTPAPLRATGIILIMLILWFTNSETRLEHLLSMINILKL